MTQRELAVVVRGIRQLRQHLEDLRHACFGSNAGEEHAHDWAHSYEFLDTLTFCTMFDGQDTILKACACTYEWLLVEPNPQKHYHEPQSEPYEGRTAVRSKASRTLRDTGIDERSRDPLNIL